MCRVFAVKLVSTFLPTPARLFPLTPHHYLPPGVANAISLQAGSPALYALVADTTSEGHAWLPATMPEGRYSGTPTPSPSPSEQTGREQLEASPAAAHPAGVSGLVLALLGALGLRLQMRAAARSAVCPRPRSRVAARGAQGSARWARGAQGSARWARGAQGSARCSVLS